jgi:hypothetical protein
VSFINKLYIKRVKDKKDYTIKHKRKSMMHKLNRNRNDINKLSMSEKKRSFRNQGTDHDKDLLDGYHMDKILQDIYQNYWHRLHLSSEEYMVA